MLSQLSYYRRLFPLALCAIALIPRVAQAGEWAGEAGLEMRYFWNDAQSPEQVDGLSPSAYLLPEYYTDWNERRDSLLIEPFFRIAEDDSERTHVDLREFHWRHVADDWELKAGISTVFWGVTESQHLVDVINQTDVVENVDGEDKLGQPMIMLRLLRDWGTIDAYLLPGFRERAFSGEIDRPGAGLIDDSLSTYESSAERYHTDFALRWTHVFGDFDVGLSHFTGTSREPRFRLVPGAGFSVALAPHYEQINQTGVDIQATLGAWLWKFEAIRRQGQGDTFTAATFGFEYSFYSVFGSEMDVGVLAEYQFDERGQGVSIPVLGALSAAPGQDNNLFVGARLGFNDIQSSELLAGCALDMDSSARFCIAEGSRRLTDHWVMSVEARLFSADADHPLGALREDDHLQLDLTYHF